jgi:hypothetical protein
LLGHKTLFRPRETVETNLSVLAIRTSRDPVSPSEVDDSLSSTIRQAGTYLFCHKLYSCSHSNWYVIEESVSGDYEPLNPRVKSLVEDA